MKGQLHIHTSYKCGSVPIDNVLELYYGKGYDFICVTEHNFINSSRNGVYKGKMMVYSGVEINVTDKIHLLLPFTNRILKASSLQEYILKYNKVGDIPIIAHPRWSGLTVRDILKLKGKFMIEQFNGNADVSWDNKFELAGVSTDDFHELKHLDKGWVETSCLGRNCIVEELWERLK